MQPQVPQRRNNSARVLARGAVLLFLFAGASFAHASATNGTIDSAHKYAWGRVAGYVNFAPTDGGITITDSGITGYAWSANTGWINFDTTQSGVTNDSTGTLAGFAWDSGAGWVNFSGVTIDSSGLFHGLATGGTVNGASYAINFDCTSCDVRTDWRPASSPVPSTGSSGGGSISPIIITTVIPPPPTVPPSASSTVTTVTTITKVSSPSPTASNASDKNNSDDTPAVSGSGANPPSLTSTTTPLNTVSTSSAIHTATTTVKKTVVSSFIDFISSIWRGIAISILILIATLVLFRFL
jgi:hypothetical protein